MKIIIKLYKFAVMEITETFQELRNMINESSKEYDMKKLKNKMEECICGTTSEMICSNCGLPTDKKLLHILDKRDKKVN